MVHPLYFIVPLVAATNLCSCTEISLDYYWREYTGKIPTDAVIGGVDINKNNVYIGQAYVKNEGLFPVAIKPGVNEIYAPIKGAKQVTENTKILCGPLENFAWLPTNSSRLHLDLLNKNGVVGGHEDGLGRINIGRISYEGGAQIGKINSFSVGNSLFFWVNKHKKEQTVNSFEVLIYQNENEIFRIDQRQRL